MVQILAFTIIFFLNVFIINVNKEISLIVYITAP